MYRVGQYSSEQLVFVDESACNKRTVYRNYGWALSGKRAIKRACFVRGRRYVISCRCSSSRQLTASYPFVSKGIRSFLHFRLMESFT